MMVRVGIAVGAAVVGLALTFASAAVAGPTAGASSVPDRAVPVRIQVRTVPALAGVRLIVAGVPVVTATDGTATARVSDSIGPAIITARARVDATTSVSIVTVRRTPGRPPPETRLRTVGLDVTSRVRLHLDPGVTGIDPAAVRGLRLHSSTGRIVTVNPSSTPTVDLLSRRTTVVHDVPITRPVTWQVDSVDTADGSVVSGSRVPFDPLGRGEWNVRLQAVPGVVTLRTQPAVAGVALRVAGIPATTGTDGTAHVRIPDLGDTTVTLADPEAGGRIVSVARVVRMPPGGVHHRNVLVMLAVSRPVTLVFTDPGGRRIPPSEITRVVLRSSSGNTVLDGPRLRYPVTLPAQVAVHHNNIWQTRPVSYSISSVTIDGGESVFAGTQRFDADSSNTWVVRLSLYTVTIELHDALLGRAVSSAAWITGPGGLREPATTGEDGVLVLNSRVRGLYDLHVNAAVLGGHSTVLVSRDSTQDLRVITGLDVAIVAAIAVTLVAGLLAGGRYLARRSARRKAAARRAWSRVLHRPRTDLAAAALVLAVGVIMGSPAATSNPPAVRHVPTFAYFYQWYTPASWNRAKQDYPLIGRYGSDNVTVLRTQVRQAMSAGITGFLTSWKSTPALNHRLSLLLDVARAEHLQIGVVYEALDFARKPLPFSTVRSDLLLLVDEYGSRLVPSGFDLPIIIWTGTDEYRTVDVRSVHRALAGRALLLAASKNVAGYQRIAADVDGEAYYWSSANPDSPATATKLDAFAAAVHAQHGIWIAPATSGFDGRTLAHTRVVGRAGGRTLVNSLGDAFGSDPDAVGVISWNEWSENTYIEPGERYGTEELDALRGYLSSLNPGAINRVTTTDPTAAAPGPALSRWPWAAGAALLAIVISASGCAAAGAVRRRRVDAPARSPAVRDGQAPR